MNENYPMPKMPKDVKDGILKGLYKFKSSDKKKTNGKVHLLGSGAILNEALKAQKILEQDFNIAADVWSVTSYKELYRDAVDVEHWNLHNSNKKMKIPFVQEVLGKENGVFIAASDYVKALPASITKWIPGKFTILGTDGFGRSENRKRLRDFFEVDARYIAYAALVSLAQEKKINGSIVKKAIHDLHIDPKKQNPMYL